MRASVFNEEQIIGILQEREVGGAVSGSFYRWMDVLDARRLNALEDEYAKLAAMLEIPELACRPVNPTTMNTCLPKTVPLAE